MGEGCEAVGVVGIVAVKANLHKYQISGGRHLFNHRYATLFWWPGMGKTLVTLLAFVGIRKKRIPGAKLLVIAPLRVALKTWPDEIKKWDETKDLRYVVLHGKDKILRLRSDADIYIINHEGLAWLWQQIEGEEFPFDGVVFDELTKFKATNTNRFRDLRSRLGKFKFRWGLTGTPAPNSLIELFGQMFVIDGGKRLGHGKGRFLSRYFFTPSAYNPYDVQPKSIAAGFAFDAVTKIQEDIRDIVHHLDPKDHLDLPPRTDIRVPVELSEEVMQAYAAFERAEVLKVDLDVIEAVHAAALVNKLQQMVQGFLYANVDDVNDTRDQQRIVKRIHEAKLDALEDIIEEASGDPVFVVYKFTEDLVMLKERFPQGLDLNSNLETRIDQWNRGEIPVLFVQPQSAGHGLNMQSGGHIIVWYALNHSLEQYIQANGRVDRQGQKLPVQVHHLVVEGTVDSDIMDVLSRRDRTQKNLLAGLKSRTRFDL